MKRIVIHDGLNSWVKLGRGLSKPTAEAVLQKLSMGATAVHTTPRQVLAMSTPAAARDSLYERIVHWVLGQQSGTMTAQQRLDVAMEMYRKASTDERWARQPMALLYDSVRCKNSADCGCGCSGAVAAADTDGTVAKS